MSETRVNSNSNKDEGSSTEEEAEVSSNNDAASQTTKESNRNNQDEGSSTEEESDMNSADRRDYEPTEDEELVMTSRSFVKVGPVSDFQEGNRSHCYPRTHASIHLANNIPITSAYTNQHTHHTHTPHAHTCLGRAQYFYAKEADVHVALFLHKGEFFALNDECPHAGGTVIQFF